MNLHLGLDQFWRIAELRHVAAEEGPLSTIHIRPEDEGLVATATDSFCLAQWDIGADYEDYDLDGPVLLVAAAIGEALAACKSMVKIDRGKWDPVGWQITIAGAAEDSVSVSAFDPFGERRGDIMVPVFHGQYPDYEKLFAKTPKSLTRMGVNPKRLIALAKTTTAADHSLFLTFRGDIAPTQVTCQHDDWRGLVVPIRSAE